MPIRRLYGEPFVEAVRREQAARRSNQQSASHLVQAMEPEEFDWGEIDECDDEDDEEEDESLYCQAERELSEADWSMAGYESDADEMEWSSDEGGVAMWTKRNQSGPESERAFPVTRSESKANARRKEVMDGVYMPPRRTSGPNTGRGKENQVPEKKDSPSIPRRAPILQPNVPIPIPPNTFPQSRAPPQPVPRQAPKPAEDIPEQRPAIQKPRYDGGREDAIMEDVSNGKERRERGTATGPKQGKSIAKEVNLPPAEEKRVPRHSDISANVKPADLLDQILNTRLDVGVGEILGVSRELSNLLHERLRVKAQRLSSHILPPQISAYTLPEPYERIRELIRARQPVPPPSNNGNHLIQIEMQCGGRDLAAIIDTGSQVNIISHELCSKKIKRPIDFRKSMRIYDANGNQGLLSGLIRNVLLSCGDVKTMANLWVSKNAPFGLLLGRPWQRNNLITIDERRSGTYLVFKDSITNEPRRELLVGASNENSQTPEWRSAGTESAPTLFVGGGMEVEDEGSEWEEVSIATESTRQGSATAVADEVPNALCLRQDLDMHHNWIANSPDEELIRHDCLNVPNTVSRRLSEWLNSDVGIVQDSLPLISLPQSMSSTPPEFSTPLTSTLPLPGLAQNQTLRLESEILRAALADLPYLKRTGNSHPLVLTTTDGVQLGQSIDPTGESHVDFLFLHGGILHVPPGLSASAAAKANAFVRVFTTLEPQEDTRWLQENPPSIPADVRTDFLKQIELNCKSNEWNIQSEDQTLASTAMPPIRTDRTAHGDLGDDSPRCQSIDSRDSSSERTWVEARLNQLNANTTSDAPSDIGSPPTTQQDMTTRGRLSLRLANSSQYLRNSPITPPRRGRGRQGARRNVRTRSPPPEQDNENDAMEIETRETWKEFRDRLHQDLNRERQRKIDEEISLELQKINDEELHSLEMKTMDKKEKEDTHPGTFTWADFYNPPQPPSDMDIADDERSESSSEDDEPLNTNLGGNIRHTNTPLSYSPSMPPLVESSTGDSEESTHQKDSNNPFFPAVPRIRPILNFAFGQKAAQLTIPPAPPIEVFHVRVETESEFEEVEDEEDQLQDEEGKKSDKKGKFGGNELESSGTEEFQDDKEDSPNKFVGNETNKLGWENFKTRNEKDGRMEGEEFCLFEWVASTDTVLLHDPVPSPPTSQNLLSHRPPTPIPQAIYTNHFDPFSGASAVPRSQMLSSLDGEIRRIKRLEPGEIPDGKWRKIYDEQLRTVRIKLRQWRGGDLGTLHTGRIFLLGSTLR